MTGIAAVVLYFTLGSKSMAVIMMAMPAMAYYEVKRKFPWKSGLAILLVFVFVVFPAYNTFRRVDRQPRHDAEAGPDRRDGARMELRPNSWTSPSSRFSNRITIVTSVAAIISDTGRWVDYKYGETLLLAPVGLLIPRFLWPDKPNMSIGREFGATFRFTNAFDRETYIAPSMVGEFYWNFAVPGVVVGMWLLGMGYRWFYQRYGAGVGVRSRSGRPSTPRCCRPRSLSKATSRSSVAGFIKSLVIIAVFVALSRRLGWLKLRAEA